MDWFAVERVLQNLKNTRNQFYKSLTISSENLWLLPKKEVLQHPPTGIVRWGMLVGMGSGGVYVVVDDGGFHVGV